MVSKQYREVGVLTDYVYGKLDASCYAPDTVLNALVSGTTFNPHESPDLSIFYRQGHCWSDLPKVTYWEETDQDWTQVIGLLVSSVPPPNAMDSPWKAVVLRKRYCHLGVNWTAITHPTHFHLNCNCETESLFSNSYKVSWGISPSDQDGVTGTRFTFLFGETIKNGPGIFYKYSKKLHIVLKKEPVCKALNTTPQMTVILQSEKQRNWAQNCPQLPVLGAFSTHGSDLRGEGKWEEPGGHPDLRRQGWVQEDRGGWNSHESCRAESYTEEKHQSCPEGPSWVLSWVLISLWMWKTTQEPGERTIWKRWRKWCLAPTYGKNGAYFHQPERKNLKINRAMGIVHRKVLIMGNDKP